MAGNNIDSKVLLVIIFNHRYDQNLSILEQIYKKRFSQICYLVPFYDGPQNNVIPVYGRSIFFQGYIAQGASHFYNESYDHYLFVADDMVLNPAINEENYMSFFEVDKNQSFISELRPLHKFGSWIGTWSGVFYKKKQKYVEAESELPSYEDAQIKFQEQGVSIRELSRKDIFGPFGFHFKTLGQKIWFCLRLFTKIRYPFKTKYKLPYPMVGSYSDILLVSGNDIKKFAHYCGVFSATCLFAEVAIPTSLALSASSKIRTSEQMKFHGRSYWLNAQNVFSESPEYTFDNLEKEYKNLDDMIERFPEDAIYLHPVKLSKWMKKK